MMMMKLNGNEKRSNSKREKEKEKERERGRKMQKHRNEGRQQETGLLFVIRKNLILQLLFQALPNYITRFWRKKKNKMLFFFLSWLLYCTITNGMLWSWKKRHKKNHRRKKIPFLCTMHFCPRRKTRKTQAVYSYLEATKIATCENLKRIEFVSSRHSKESLLYYLLCKRIINTWIHHSSPLLMAQDCSKIICINYWHDECLLVLLWYKFGTSIKSYYL